MHEIATDAEKWSSDGWARTAWGNERIRKRRKRIEERGGRKRKSRPDELDGCCVPWGSTKEPSSRGTARLSMRPRRLDRRLRLEASPRARDVSPGLRDPSARASQREGIEERALILSRATSEHHQRSERHKLQAQGVCGATAHSLQASLNSLRMVVLISNTSS